MNLKEHEHLSINVLQWKGLITSIYVQAASDFPWLLVEGNLGTFPYPC